MSMFGNDKVIGNKTDNREAFFNDCVEAYYNEMQSNGYCSKQVFVPELLQKGQTIVLEFLKDPFFQAQFGDNPIQYYYIINSLSLQAGCVLADIWHKDNSEVDSFTDIVIEKGPAQYAKPLFEEHFGLDSDGDAGEKMYSKIFDKWLELHEPYWNLNDPREYTFNATLAAYQIGASMILEKYGY